MSDIETRLFRYFVAVAEEQHFARAALRLRISPPTLTYQIKKLESQLGAKLLERKGNRQVVVTEAGQRFLARAREVLRQVEEAAAIARQAGRGELGRLELGFVISVSCAGLLRSWIGAFQQINPAIDITIHKLAPIAQITGILRKELDGGFTRTPLKYPSGVRGFVNLWCWRCRASILSCGARTSAPRCSRAKRSSVPQPSLTWVFRAIPKPSLASAASYRAWSSEKTIS
jgi:DNA-binding transcriptional LysR family regulator